ncbi:MAG: alanine--tRNA ligase [Acidobacteriota bacterium]|nr:alanine--tRNA ligase [Acidobacteriota bacterium]
MAGRKHMSGSEIREMFLRYFEQQGHRRVHSSSLVPANDPTLLFTNAGMNQFKDVFLGLEKRDYNRACSSQKCVRAGGKHNDLENVGFTSRHHTFFEMLGNFSFGDYFKQEAIQYAWELVTSPAWYGVDKSKLYATIFQGEQGIPRDDEAEKHWLGVGVPKERIFAMGMKDNFWAMGDTGPCGPCSELHIDQGVEASDHKNPECAAGKCRFPCPHDCGRYMEIWNLVFMQFDRDAAGNYNPLPKPSIDTGMGLERLAAVLQGVISNYDTDLFKPLMEYATGALLSRNPGKTLTHNPNAPSLRIIADHSRAFTFLISDGVIPGNEGRGYVLRKIIRRAIRHARLMGADNPCLFEMVAGVAALMKDAYPELLTNQHRVAEVVRHEELRFAHTIAVGLDRLDKDIGELAIQGGRTHNLEHLASRTNPDDKDAVQTLLGFLADKGVQLTYPGDNAFKLYDTFGLPFDFMMDAARDQGLHFDVEGFERAMQAQRERARASWKGGAGKAAASPVLRDLAKTVFEGYAQTESTDCEVLAIVKGGAGVKELKPGEEGEVVLDHTPFYADSGGQVGDVGWLLDSARNVIAEVRGCTLPVQGVRAHQVIVRRGGQPIVVGDRVVARVNAEVRQHTMRNHTATHLLHAALREVLGKHVKQAGSLVDPAHLRFDFSHFTGVADEELQDIEDLANKEVLRNEKIQVINDVPIDVAVNEYHAMALFGEKYGERVRVIKIGDFSTELCGGIHTGATGEIGLIKVLKEGSVSSGVRRVEAVTGEGSLRHFRKDHELESVVGTFISTAVRGGEQQSPATALRAELDRRDEELKKLRKELEQSRMKTAASAVSATGDSVRTVKGVKVAVQRVENVDRNQMRVLVDNLRNKLGSGVVVLGSASQEDGKVAIVVGVTKDLTDRVQAGKIVGQVAKKVGGSGGGRPDMAEAGGKDPAQLDAALDSAYAVVEALLT